MRDYTGRNVIDDRPTEPQYNEIPEEAFHDICEGEGCEGCGGTGIDPVKEAEYAAAAKAEADAQYEAWLDTVPVRALVCCSICGAFPDNHDEEICRAEYED